MINKIKLFIINFIYKYYTTYSSQNLIKAPLCYGFINSHLTSFTSPMTTLLVYYNVPQYNK